jgi:hypothetical protein
MWRVGCRCAAWGSERQFRDSVTVEVELVDAKGQRFVQPMGDLITLQQGISPRIAEQLLVKFSSQQQQGLIRNLLEALTLIERHLIYLATFLNSAFVMGLWPTAWATEVRPLGKLPA